MLLTVSQNGTMRESQPGVSSTPRNSAGLLNGCRAQR